jgi:hypothetical protein
MENEIFKATSIHQINSILNNCAGQYDLDIVALAKEGIGIAVKKGIIETIVGAGTVHEYTGRDVYSVESTKELTLVKDLVIKSIRYRDFTMIQVS